MRRPALCGVFLPSEAFEKLAAQTIQQGWSAQIQTASQNGRPALGVGIGIHTGVASIGEVGKACKELAITGPVVNLAARIQGAAKGGETLVSEAAYQQAVDVAHGGETRHVACVRMRSAPSPDD